MEQVLVIYEKDTLSKDTSVIGVASTQEKAIELIKEYYGENSIFSDIKYIEESGIEFYMSVDVASVYGGIYDITVFYFNIDVL